MKKRDTSRPPLSLPMRLGVLALVTAGGVATVASVMARQNGTDLASSLSTMDLGKAYSKQNLSYIQAELKLKLGDRRGCAQLVKTLPLRQEDENLSYRELQAELVRAQLDAGELTEALTSAQDDRGLQKEVLQRQCDRQGIGAMQRNAARLRTEDYRMALATLAAEYAGVGNLKTAEGLVAELAPKDRESVYTSLMSAYYRARQFPAALATAKRLTDPEQEGSALTILGSSCLAAQDAAGLRQVLASLPLEAPKKSQLKLGNQKAITVNNPAKRGQLLQSASWQLPPATALALIRDFAHPADLPELLRSTSSRARSKRDRDTVKASLALLRAQASEAGRNAYDQELQQLFYDRSLLDQVGEPLRLALSAHEPRLRGQLLCTLGQYALEKSDWQGLPKILAHLRSLVVTKNALAQSHDLLILNALPRLTPAESALAATLTKQLLRREYR